MKCTVCGSQMKEVTERGVTIDVCADGCGGIWFDNFEFKKFDEQHESATALLSVKPKKSVQHAPNEKRSCPRCETVKMINRFFSVARKVLVDECPQCGGVWLDAGELLTVRGLFKNEKEREAAAKEVFAKDFDASLQVLRARSQSDAQTAERFARMFKYICPSYWIPGKQQGGAF